MMRCRFTYSFLVVLALAVASCGRMAPTSPDVGLDPSASANQSSTQMTTIGLAPDEEGPVANLVQPVLSPIGGVVDPVLGLVGGVLRLVQNVVKLVLPGIETNVHTTRWSLDIHPGSLTTSKVIRITQATDGMLRADFGPEGTQFGTPVDVTVSYAGTSLDPSSRAYVRGTVPVFLWLDPSTGKWVEMPSTFDPATCTVHAQLHHFSSYGVGGRAGW